MEVWCPGLLRKFTNLSQLKVAAVGPTRRLVLEAWGPVILDSSRPGSWAAEKVYQLKIAAVGPTRKIVPQAWGPVILDSSRPVVLGCWLLKMKMKMKMKFFF